MKLIVLHNICDLWGYCALLKNCLYANVIQIIQICSKLQWNNIFLAAKTSKCVENSSQFCFVVAVKALYGLYKDRFV